MWSPCTITRSRRMPRAGLPCMVSRTCVVRRPEPAIRKCPFAPRRRTIGKFSRPSKGVGIKFLPTGPLSAILSRAGPGCIIGQMTENPPRYPRNMQGYGPNPPDAQWPGGANVAVQFVLNYEEGGENNILHGDGAVRGLPRRRDRRRALAGRAALERRVDVRVRRPRRLLAAPPAVHRATTCRSPSTASPPR